MPIVTLTVRRPKSTEFKVVFQDVPWENWSPAGGRVSHA
jgi:phenylpyruvate tautomerase PptA (4-oxalocrotonate tautomerase family)